MGIFNKILNTNSEDSFIKLVRAVDRGEEWAQEKMQELWEKDDGTLVPRVHRARVSIYEQAAKGGDRNAILLYARGLAWSDRQREALDYYMFLIDHNDAEAMLELATDYNEYGPLGPNKTEEMKWLKRSAEAGNAEAQVKLARELTIVRDPDAAYWYSKAASQGNVDGMLGYSAVLQERMLDLLRCIRDVDSITDDDCILLKRYEIEGREDCLDVIAELYNTIEELLVGVLNESQDETTLSNAYSRLSMHYLYVPQEIGTPDIYRGAFFQYMQSYVMNDRSAYEKFLKIVKENNLRIDNQDLSYWENGSFDDWAERKMIYQ